MAAETGKLGRVQYGGVDVFRLSSWSADFDVNMLDVTTFTTGAPQWRSFVAGLSQVTGTVSGFWDMEGSTAQKDMQTNVLTPTTAQLILYLNSSNGSNYRGSCYLNRLSAQSNIDGTNDVSFDFQGTGTWSYSTAT